MDPMIISLTVFIAVACVVAAVFYLVSDIKGTKAEERLSSLTGLNPNEEGAASITKEDIINDSLTGLSGVLKGISQKFTGLSLLLEQSGSSLKGEALVMFSLLAGGIGVFIAFIARAPIPIWPVAAMVSSFLPLIFILFKRKRRMKAFAHQLPEALELVSRALRSGHSLSSGLSVVVEEMPAPISDEFGKVYEEQNLGVTMEDALKSMLKRIPNLDLKFLVTAVAIQRTAGGDLAEILDKISHIIRERFKILGQVQALTGEGRISGIVLMALPPALFFAVYYLNPDYVMLLFTDENGRKMIAGAVFLQILGAIAIKKIINIKV